MRKDVLVIRDYGSTIPVKHEGDANANAIPFVSGWQMIPFAKQSLVFHSPSLTKSSSIPIRHPLNKTEADIHALAVLLVGTTFLPSLLYLTRGGGARLRRPSRERTL